MARKSLREREPKGEKFCLGRMNLAEEELTGSKVVKYKASMKNVVLVFQCSLQQQ